MKLKIPPIYISYAWGNPDSEEEKVVHALCDVLTSLNYEIIRDRDYLKYLDNLPAFLKKIGNGGYVIAIVGEKYLQSENCMIEASYMAHKGSLKQRVFPLILSSLNRVFKIEQRNNLIIELHQFWKSKEEELRKSLEEKQYPQGFISMRQDLSSLTQLINYSSEFINHIGTSLQISAQEHLDEKFKRLFERIKERIDIDLREIRESLGIDENRKAARVSLAHLPITGAARYGREQESNKLRDAWEQEKINVLTVVGWGGEGKSSLINSWLATMAKERYQGADAVFGWCFYDAEMKNQEASADVFITSALKWLGDADPTHGSPWEKGVRLADLVRAQRMLLILDGIETLQHHAVGSNEGHIKDPSFLAFLKELAAQNPGLCVVTTRLSVTDLLPSVGNTVEELILKPLDCESGACLLSDLGVTGSHREIVHAAEEYGGHALSLTLLGSYLVEVCNGDVTRRDEIGTPHEDKAQQVMISYEHWLGEGPELQILYLLGVFNRPTLSDAMYTLRSDPSINGITDHLTALDKNAWNRAVSRLRRLKLVAEVNPQKKDLLDTHPLVREHFSKKLQREHPEAWKEANNRLFEYYKNLPKQELPDTLEEMIPLFHAVTHGCQAGRHQEALEHVYWPRIRRKNEGFSVLTLNLYGADLVSLTSFFERRWDRPVTTLNEISRAIVSTEAAFDLRGLGRLEDAVIPQRAGLEAHRLAKRWIPAANAAGNLSELLATLGQLDHAISDAELSIELAKNSGDTSMLVINTATLADALYQSGKVVLAEKHFREADAIYKKHYPDTADLHGLLIYHFCDLLIGQNKFDEVMTRCMASLRVEQSGRRLHRIGLAHLSLAKAQFAECMTKTSANFDAPNQNTETALEYLRKAGHQELIVRALLFSTEIHRVMGNFKSAESDLDEAMATAIRGQMKLYQADALLQNVHLKVAISQIPKAKELFSTAQQMVRSMGYHLKDSELDRLESTLQQL